MQEYLHEVMHTPVQWIKIFHRAGYFFEKIEKPLDLELTPRSKIFFNGGRIMTIKEVCEQFDITADTLRYYERVGAIPQVGRTAGGIRNYTEEDLKWIQNALCLRGAGVPVEMILHRCV